MRKAFSLISLVALTSLLCAGVAFAATVKIGLMAPITGAFASEGQDMQKLLELMVEETNKSGGVNGAKVELIVEDDGSTPRSAATAASRLVSKGVPVAIGTYGSAVTEASQDIYDEAGIVQIGTGSTSIRLTSKGMKRFFRTCPRDDEQGRVAQETLAKLGFKKVAILHDNSAYAKGLADETSALIKAKKSADIIFFDALVPGERDYSAILTKLKGVDHRVRLWDMEKSRFVMDLEEHLDWVRGLAFSPERNLLGTVGQDGQIKLWDVGTGKRHLALKNPIRGSHQLCFHPDGTHFAVCGYDAEVRVFLAETGALVHALPTPGTGNRALAFSPDGTLLAAAGRSGIVRIWRTEDGKHLTDLKGDGRRVNALTFHPNGSILAVAGDGPRIMFFQPQTGTKIGTLPERPGKTYSLAFCGDTILASGESDNAIRLWDLTSGRQISTLLGHTGTISSLIYEPARQQLISGGFDTTIRFWDVESSVPAPAAPPVMAAVPLSAPAEPAPIVATEVVLELAPAPELFPVVDEEKTPEPAWNVPEPAPFDPFSAPQF